MKKRMVRWFGWLVTSWAVCMVAGCVFFKKPKTPMGMKAFPSKKRGSHLLVLLPGLGDRPGAFEKGGFIEEARAVPQFDVVVADAHFGYYRTFSVRERLFEDVIGPIREKYDELWLVGVSMGGYGAIAYAEKYPDQVTGIVLLAPYLGQNKVVRDIEKAGSLAQWDPDAFDSKGSERTAHSVTIWRWLQDRPASPDEPIVVLGTGADDRHMREVKLLRPAIPETRVHVVPGGHEWGPWRELFHTVVDDHLAGR